MLTPEARAAAGAVSGGRPASCSGGGSSSSSSDDETEPFTAGRRQPGGAERLQKTSRKIAKPIMEKRRRARINASLNELKSLLVEVLQSEGCRHSSKMEKADILEMTVKHLRQLQRQHSSAPAGQRDASAIDKYALGYNECLNKVCGYLHSAVDSSTSVDANFAVRLVNHLLLRLRKSGHEPPRSGGAGQSAALQQPRALDLAAAGRVAANGSAVDGSAAAGTSEAAERGQPSQQQQQQPGSHLHCGGAQPSSPETGPGTMLLAGGGLPSVDDYCRALPRAFVLSRLHGISQQMGLADRPPPYGPVEPAAIAAAAAAAAARAAAAAAAVSVKVEHHKIVVPVPTVVRNPLANRGPNNMAAAAAADAHGLDELSPWRPW